MDLPSLWLPIVASAAGVFVASSIVWMALPIHKKDYLALDGGEAMHEWLKRRRPPVGRYMVGGCQPGKEKGATPAKVDPNEPRGILLVQYGAPNMGKTLALWFLHSLVLSALVAYVATFSLRRGAGSVEVLRVTSTTALLAYGGGAMPKALWEGVPWRHVPGAVFDALVYAFATGGVFALLWPR